MKSEFTKRLGKLRKEKGLSQREAASILGISQALLSHYENGAREPGLEFVMQVCDLFDVTSDYLLGRSSERNSAASILTGKVHEIVTELEVLRIEEAELLKQLGSLTNDNSE